MMISCNFTPVWRCNEYIIWGISMNKGNVHGSSFKETFLVLITTATVLSLSLLTGLLGEQQKYVPLQLL